MNPQTASILTHQEKRWEWKSRNIYRDYSELQSCNTPPYNTGKSQCPIIQGKVSLENSILYSDGWKGYDGLVDVWIDKHFRVNHGKSEFSLGNGIHINGIENFWSFTKRRLNKFNGVKVNFHLHLKECEWRYTKESFELEQELITMIKDFYKKSRKS